jgi:alpha-L-rhamnosidase
MIRMLQLLIPFSFIALASFAQVSVDGLLLENRVNPSGIDIIQPQFSWQLKSVSRNIMQTAYEIHVAENPDLLKGTTDLVWNSGRVNSKESVHVTYDGKPLESGKKYFWQVKVWTNKQDTSAWSLPACWQMGLLQPSDWKAKWIKAGYQEDSVLRPSPLLRRTFDIKKKINSATLYITSHGLYEAFLNGKKISDAYLTPGWTSYNKRLQYQVYDVTDMVKEGKNAAAVMLGSGWYRGYIAWNGNKNSYGKELGLLYQLELTYTDGTADTIISDESWKSNTGAITGSEIYNGETYDAREEKTGWMDASYNDNNWYAAKTSTADTTKLIASYNEPIKKHETFQPVKIFTTPKGEQIIDFGQNLVGWVMIKARGAAGDKIVIDHAEVLDKEGNFYTTNLRAAKQENTYILKGGGEENFEPHFTFQGFRYIRIQGYPGQIKPENFTAVALYSDMKPTGTFSSSSPLINQLQHNIQWGQKGNFLDVPTDCPQRDERLGWTGDAQVFSRTASFNMQVNNFFAKWLQDLAADQFPSGAVPHVIPNVLGPNAGGSAGWSDASTVIPWNMWLAYADKRILERQYPSMKAWVTYMENNSTDNLWNVGAHFGDWLFYRPEDDNDGRSAITDKYLIAQAFYAHSTQLLINAANVLGKKDEVRHYKELLKKIKGAFTREYMTSSGRLVSGSQTAYVLALSFDLLPEDLRQQAADRLVQNIKDYNNHLTTGFLGTPYLCHVLSRFGYTDLAYTLLTQETYPSWLYAVKMGATTIWERWDGQKPDGSFQTPAMNSFNHYSYGAIGDWMYRVAVGLDTDESAPGYKKIRIMPHPGKRLSAASVELETYYGKVATGWKIQNDTFLLDVEVPVNTTAKIYIPGKSKDVVTESGKPLTDAEGIKLLKKEDNYIVVEAGSGSYHFVSAPYF